MNINKASTLNFKGITTHEFKLNGPKLTTLFVFGIFVVNGGYQLPILSFYPISNAYF